MADQTPIDRNPKTVIPALQNLKRGEKLVYHRGFLDRAPHGVTEIASAAGELSDAGKVTLTQRRLGPPMFRGEVDWHDGVGPGFEYIATGV
jgi:hypothetical protein